MQGSVRKKGATWSYRIELGMAAGKRNQVERSGFKTKSEATKAMNEVIYHYNMTGDFVENKKITFKEVYNEFIEKEAPATRAYATVVRYKSLYRNHLQESFDKYYMYQITPKMIDDFINEKMMSYSEEYVKGIFKLLKVLFGFAHKRQYTKKNIFPSVTAPPDPRHVGEIKVYTSEERQAMETRLHGTNVSKAVKGVSVTIKDKTTEKTGTTDATGKVTLPVKSSGGGSSSGGGRGGSSGGSYISSNITNITVTDKNGKTVSVSKSTDKDGKITLTLPNGADLTGDNYYTIKATDNKGNAKAEISIVLKDKKNNTANGTTDKNGMLILPGSKHKAYIMGYPDGSFRPDIVVTRAEVVTIINRATGRNADTEFINKNLTVLNRFTDVKNNSHWAAYDIFEASNDHTGITSGSNEIWSK